MMHIPEQGLVFTLLRQCHSPPLSYQQHTDSRRPLDCCLITTGVGARTDHHFHPSVCRGRR